MVERDRGPEQPIGVETLTDHADVRRAAERDAVRSAPDGTAEDERHSRVMASAKRVMRKHRNVFAALAK